MKTEEIRNLLSNIKLDDRYFSKFELNNALNASLNSIKNKVKQISFKQSNSERWLADNYDFFIAVKKSICIKHCKIRMGFKEALIQIISSDMFSGSREDVILVLEELNKMFPFKEIEIKSIRDAFLISNLELISQKSFEDIEKIPHLVRCLHSLFQVDFSRFIVHFSPIEKILRLDPAGLYTKMTSSTRAYYREKIKSEAKSRKMKPELVAKEKLDKATREEKHIGVYLKKSKPARMYFPANIMFSIIVSFVIFLFSNSLILTLFAIPIVYFPVKSFVDLFYSFIRKSERLPAMKCDTVAEEEKTCIAIATLICNEKDITEQVSKLKQYCVNNKCQNDKLYFGLLCDLPQSKKPVEQNDQKLISKLATEIEKLNDESPCFFALIRKRVYHKSENAFVGWERKRGAIEQFVDVLIKNDIPKTHTFFGTREIFGSKFIISLDSDTELGIGQAKRLIGRMIHPLNRPRVVKLNNGKKCVTSGYGILQPKVASSLLNPITTPFAKIFSNGSGSIPYADASFDSMQTLFGEGNFCGKGIIDVATYHDVLSGVFPEQKILSHDMPEGALLRSAIVADEYFLDSDPQGSISSDQRLHRWIRGDVQNLQLFSMLPQLRIIFALENLLRYCIPIFQFLLLFVSAFHSKKLAVFSCALIVLSEFFPFIREILSFLVSGNFQLFGRRFQTKMRNRLLNSFYQCLLSILSIAHKAYFYSDAIFRSLYRMLISKKKLLAWQTYSPFTHTKKDPLQFYLPSIALSVLLLFFSHTISLLLISLSFVFYPFIMLALSEKYVETDLLSKHDRSKLQKIAQKEFSYFKNTVNESSSYLPPDNIQFEPVEKIANRTSPTNIGLYLASLISAVDLNILTEKECIKLLSKAMDSIDKMEHFQGHLYNWYDLSTLGVIGDRFVSTVDSGNFIASLIIVSQVLFSWGENEEYKILRNRIESEIKGANFKILFDQHANLFFVGVFPDDENKCTSHYDLYMSEARTTSYLAIATGQINASHWYTTKRPVLAISGRVGIGSWTGTCFEYFMPTLFLPIVENSLEDESLDFAHFCQKKYSVRTQFGNLYGISESGYTATDEAENLQYMAFGVPYLSIKERYFSSKVISPYSSFLMLPKAGKKIFENLKVLEKIGAIGPMGFFEAVEFNSNFIDDYDIVRSYMAHHKGMSFLSLANVLSDWKNANRFMSRTGFNEKKELLAERFPIEGKIYSKKNVLEDKARKSSSTKKQAFPLIKNLERGGVLSDGKVTLVSYNNGKNRVLYKGLDIFHSEKGGICCRIYSEKDVYSFYDNQENGKYHFTNCGIENILVSGKKTAVLKMSPIFGKNSLFLRIELSGFSERCRVEVEFHPRLLNENHYNAHPAFHNLSLECSSDGKHLFLRRRGVKEHKEIHFYSTQHFKTKLAKSEKMDYFEKRMLMEPRIKLLFDFPSAETCIIPIFICLDNSTSDPSKDLFDGSFEFVKSIRQIAEKKINRIDEICKIDKASAECFNKLLLLIQNNRKYFFSDLPSQSKEFLWKNGISGDRPIISIHLKSNGRREIKALCHYISAYKKLIIAGINEFDLVILHQNYDGYFNPIRDEISAVISRYQCDYLIGKHPGIHAVICTEEEIQTWAGISALFLGDDNDLLSQVSEADIEVIGTDYKKSKSVTRVGTMNQEEFLIEKDLFDPNVPFSHIISNSRLGFVCNQNSLGFTWFRNAGLNRISKWDNLPTKKDGEKIYLKIGNKYFDLLQIAKKVSYRNSLVVYEGEIFGKSYSVIATVLDVLALKNITILFSSKPERDARLIYSFIPCLGQKPDKNIFIKQDDGFVMLSPCIQDEYSGKSLFYAGGKEISVGRFEDRLMFSTECSEQNSYFLGGFSSVEHLEYLKRELCVKIEDKILKSIENVKQKNHFETPLEFWMKYQVYHSRFLGRTGVYQSSGAYGFRDQLQDSLVFLKDEPKKTKIHLFRCAAHQFEEGDVLHWWHPIRNKERCDPGIRSRCSDDYLWLIYGVDAYVRETGDLDVLKTTIPFIISEPLKPHENERYISPKRGENGTLLEHLERAAKLFIARGLEEHNLPHIGSGDWNDGMNEINGESVWLGFFGAICLSRLKKYVSTSLQKEIDAHLAKLKIGLDASFNGAWFPRAYRSDGEILGSDISLESECSIDLITQAFSAFYFIEFLGTEFSLNERKVQSALKAAFDILVDQKHRIIKLFTKPFETLSPSPGYIQRYCAGVRENGGQYTHAAVWFGMALLDFATTTNDTEMFKKAEIVRDLLNPTENIDIEKFRIYQREPYVLCGDVYDAKGFRGHGGWSWYTGAAGWYFQLLKKWRNKI